MVLLAIGDELGLQIRRDWVVTIVSLWLFLFFEGSWHTPGEGTVG